MPPFRKSLLAATVSLCCLPGWAGAAETRSCPMPLPRAEVSSLERAARQQAHTNAPVHLRADNVRAQKGGISELEGSVELIRGTDRVTADHLRYEQPTNTARADGHVQYRDGDGNMVYTEQFRLNLTTREGETGLSRFVVNNERGRGDRV
jgi:lipopolysaccharide assembly outer membrane protein LptD (OstA)